MTTPLSLPKFLDLLQRSNLLAPASLAMVRAEVARDRGLSEARTLADRLVFKGLLSNWQAEQLLAGRLGFVIGPYVLRDKIASGAMGSVYRAERIKDRLPVALKIISGALAHQGEALGRFLVEIRATTTMRHPNIISAIEADREGERLYLAMEFVEGRNLKEWVVEEGSLPVPFACECLRQVSIGLQYAHDQGMVHRDIKPANLIVTREGPKGPPIVKILDLGLARFLGEAKDQRLTLSGQMMGTPDYISPEQARNTKHADARSDIFSMGCSLFELLTGRLPFEGKNVVEKLMARVQQDAPPVRSVRKDIPAAVENALAKMLARDPADRYQTALDVAKALAPLSGTAFPSPGG
ncbi:MAG: serine/threonine-protein kinase [Planctomycetota bacterium]